MKTSLLDQNTSMFNSWRDPPLLIIHQKLYGLYAGMGRHDPAGFSFLPGVQPFTIPDMAICLAGSSENLDQGSQRMGFSSVDSTCKDSAEFKGCYFIGS